MNRRIAIIGGTGALGTGLAVRWARYGHQVIIGSRDLVKAREHVELLSHKYDLVNIRSASNPQSALDAEFVCIAVPYAAHETTLIDLSNSLEGRIVIEATVPLLPPKVSVVQLPLHGSLAAHTQSLLGERAKVVSALHNVSAELLQKPNAEIDCDVMVFGNDEAACAEVMTLIEHLDLRGVRAGPIGNSVAAEAMTSVLIGINRRYKAHGAGIRFTGLPQSGAA